VAAVAVAVATLGEFGLLGVSVGYSPSSSGVIDRLIETSDSVRKRTEGVSAVVASVAAVVMGAAVGGGGAVCF
jgi:hypothetical protein